MLRKLFISGCLLVAGLTLVNGQQPLRIAMAQIYCINSDREGNFRRIEYALEDAAAAGAQLVCFPETSIYGWVNPEAHDMASSIPGADSDRLCQLAKVYKTYICIGLCEKDGDKLYDSVILIDPQGKILLKHHKINTLDELMDIPYTKGKGVQTVETPFGKIGLLICADSFVEEILGQMSELQPDLVLIPYGWAASKDQWPKHGESLKNAITHATEIMNCPVIGTDVVGSITHGPWTGMVYGGQSYAIDKNGKVLAKGRDRERDILIVDLTL